jgi:Caspase domain
MTRAAAVIVGIDAYRRQPLTSAVNDANAVRDALIGLGSLAEHDITLLTTKAGKPTRSAIRDALRVIHGLDSLRVIYISGRRACMKDDLFLEMIGLPHTIKETGHRHVSYHGLHQ